MPTQTLGGFGDNVSLSINTTGANLNWFQVVNNDPLKSAKFNLLDNSNNVIWSFTQPPSSTSAQVPIPTIDNFGQPIVYVIGQQLQKNGTSVQTLISPPWNFLTV